MDFAHAGDERSSQHKAPPKALRFVTNYGAPHPKRRRIGAACLTCRKRKTACSGERPSCETCKQNKLECAGYSSEGVVGPPAKHANSENTLKVEPFIEKHTRAGRSPLKQEQEDTPTSNRKSPAPTRQPTQTANESVNAESEPAPERPMFSGPRNRMPYFRWLGPTAIMPGFKQMVVKVKRSDNDVGRSSTDGIQSPSMGSLTAPTQPLYSSGTPGAVESDVRTQLSLPFYDTSPMPPSELITHLANTFFTHLGCNYPFLPRERFLRDLEEKQVDAILVDAVCALAARFSRHPLLTQQPNDESKSSPAEYGHAFAVRAKTSLLETFACPSVAAVQAALLLAYNEFGESRDSGLWMYLGIAIRMAQDLGMHKLEGLRYKGRDGPTPKAVKQQLKEGVPTVPAKSNPPKGVLDEEQSEVSVSEQKAVEQERVDTFWAVFFLDRVISSGTGRRSTLRDKDIELSFPSLDETDPKTGWPAPFPALIRIIHLYGRVADLLNSIQEHSDITQDISRRLAAMEDQVTHLYQGLSSHLHFDAVNFQHYMKAGEGTNFVLLHFWFHTLIVLLHRPTLLKTFEGNMLQLFPNSQQLSMSSAKTIADILSYSQLMDAKASLGNPFTSQPIYIAACAFLKETAEQTATSNAQSRSNSPTRHAANPDSSAGTHVTQTTMPKRVSIAEGLTSKKTSISTAEQKALAKHTLLATAANQHYQLCYKALESLETYWAGTKYILTVLDQKFKGVGDPLLYTVEEGESAMEQPRPEPAFTSPGWRRKLSWGSCSSGPANSFFPARGFGQVPGSPSVDPQKAIGWTLTGTMDSNSTNVVWHYPSGANNATSSGKPSHFGLRSVNTLDFDKASNRSNGHSLYTQHLPSSSATSQIGTPPDPSSRPDLATFPRSSSARSTGDEDLLISMNSPFQRGEAHQQTANRAVLPFVQQATPESGNFPFAHVGDLMNFPMMGGLPFSSNLNMQSLGDMEIAPVNDVDMSMLGLDMMPWFDPYSDMMDPEMMNADGDRVTATSVGGTVAGNGSMLEPSRINRSHER